VGVSNLIGWWPLGIVVLVLGSVVVAFVHCAVAEAVMRLAAWIYTPNPAERGERVEAWRRVLEEATPKERPQHAASFLWMAVRHLPARRPYRPSQPSPTSTLAFEYRLSRSASGEFWLRVIRRDDGSNVVMIVDSKDEAAELVRSGAAAQAAMSEKRADSRSRRR
jgi:hypothetical protein